MAETLRDMVVSLSLNSDNFSANLRSINAQLKEADSEFKAAAAGVQGFENTTAGAQAKLEQLNQKFKLQQQAVQQYEKALGKAQQKLETSAQTHDKLTQKLDEAKQKHSDLGQEVERLTQELDQAKAAGLEGTDAYNQMETELQQLKEEYAQSGQEVEKLEAQLQKSDAAMQKNADGVTRAQTNLNNAKAALQSTGAEIDATASRLQKMQSAWTQAADKMAAFGKKASEVGKNLEGAGRNVSKVSAVAAAAGTAAVVTFANYDDAIRQVYATMGLSASENADQMEALSAAAQEMGASTRYSASEAASALNYLALAGYSSDQAIGALPTVLRLAQAGGIDLASASDMVTDSMSALGLEMSEMPTFADQMAKASQKSNTSVAQLGEGILKVSATAKNLKGGTVELNTVLGILADNGIKGAEGGTHLRNMILSLQNPTDKAAAQLKTLGVNVYDAEGKMRGLDEIFGDLQKAMGGMTDEARDAALSEIFNKTDLAAVGAMLSNCGDRFDELSAEIENSQGVAENMADMMEGGIGGAFRSFKSAVEGLAISFGDTLAPMVQSVAEHITEYVRKFTEADEGTKKMVVTIGAVIAAAGPALLILGKLISSVGTIATAISKGMTAVSGFASAIGSFAGSLSLASVCMGALVAAVPIGIGLLVDWASGARAAREAQAQFNETVKEWGENVTTSYEKAKGLQSFGLTAGDFGPSSTTSGSDWLTQTLETWTDGKGETDQIVSDTVKSFTDGTDKIRQSLQGMRDSVGEGGLVGDLDTDMSSLDEIDGKIEAILKKRQNGYLSESDQQELQSLIDQRESIAVKYHLEEDGGTSGFDEIQRKVDAAMSRTQKGSEESTKVFAEGYAAAAQGAQAYTDNLNAQYDAQYAVVSAMEDGEAKTKAMGELQEWYGQQVEAGNQAYAETIQQLSEATGAFDAGGDLDQTATKIQAVQTAMEQLGAAGKDTDAHLAAMEQLESALDGLDETSVVELSAALATADAAGVELPENLANAESAIERIKALTGDGGLELFGEDTYNSLESMFGSGLNSEMLEIAATLNTDNLASVYDAWAQGSHADIIPGLGEISAEDATVIGTVGVNGVITTIDPLTGEETVIGKANITGTIKSIDPLTGEEVVTGKIGVDGKVTTIDPLTGEEMVIGKVRTDGKIVHIDPLTGEETVVGKVNMDGTITTIDPLTGEETVVGKVSLGGTVAIIDPVTGKKVVGKVDVDGKITTIDPLTGEETVIGVVGLDGKITTLTVPTTASTVVSLKASVQISNIDAATISKWKSANKIELEPVKVNLGLGGGWQSKLKDAYDAGLLEVYGADGAKIPITPEVLTQITDKDLVALDEDGTVHVIITPEPGSPEGVEASNAQMNSTPQAGTAMEGTVIDKIAESTQHRIDVINSLIGALNEQKAAETEAAEAGNMAEATQYNEAAARTTGQLAAELDNLSDADLSAIGTQVEQLAAALASGNGSESQIAEWTSQLTELQTVISGIDAFDTTSTGTNIMAGIGHGMTSYSFDGDAASAKGTILSAINSALGVASPASTMVPTGENVAAGIGQGMSQYDFGSDASTVAGAVESSVSTAMPASKFTDIGKTAVGGLAQGMRQTSTVATAGRSLGTAATNAVKSALPASAWSSVGSQAMAGLAAGIRSGASSVISAAAAAAASALAAAKNALGISSPSKVFRDEVGKMVMKGLGEGIVDETDAQARIIANASRHLTETAQGAVGGVTNNRATYNQQSSISFAGATFIIRNESVIHELAVEITDLTRKRQRAFGS